MGTTRELPRDIYEEIDFHKYWQVLKRRWLPAAGVFAVTLAMTAAAVMTRQARYEAEGKLLFRSDRTSTFTGLGEGTGRLEALSMQNNPLDTQAEVVRSVPVLEETIKALQLNDDEGNPISPKDLAEGLKVRGIAGTDVLHITYTSDDPELAAKVVNKISEIFIRKNIQSNRAEAVSARAFIEQQLPKTEEAVRVADLELRRFREQNRIVALEQEAEESVKLMATLENQLAQAQAQLADVTARSAKLRSRVGLDAEQALAITTLSQSEGVQEALKQLQQAQQQLAIEQTRYREGHPTIANLQRRVAALNTLLNQRVGQMLGQGPARVALSNLQLGDVERELVAQFVQSEVERDGLNRRIRSLDATRSELRQRANVMPGLQQVQRELERRLKAAETTYEALLTRLQEVQVAENQNIGNARIISPALVPDTPTGPRKALLLAGGGMAGLLLALVTAFGLDLVDRSVKTLKEAKELFGYTPLGVIPLIRTGKIRPYAGNLEQPIPWVVVRDLPRSALGEAYQMLQANLKFLLSDKPLKTMVVTSSVPKEGKSSVSANLAAAIAQVGRSVLLIDADMRHPAQHHIWDLTNAVGLSNLIVDQVDLDAAVQAVMPNLHVLTAGVVPPNPIALLDSKRMASLLDTFSEQYDYVIFDCPPLAGTADAAVLGKLADGVLLVVRPGVVDAASATAAKEFLAQSGQNVLGMVLNGVNVGSEPEGYFYYAGELSDQDFGARSLSAIATADRTDS